MESVKEWTRGSSRSLFRNLADQDEGSCKMMMDRNATVTVDETIKEY